jgi:hypothetical protein
MDGNSVKVVLVAILSVVGAFELLPFIVKKALDVVREVLDEVADFAAWYREWKSKNFVHKARHPSALRITGLLLWLLSTVP